MDSSANSEYSVTKAKCVFLGDYGGIGKTCIILRFMYETFDQAYKATIGIDFVSKTLCFNEKSVRLQLWDTAGQERFRSLIPSYIKDSFVAIVVYDVTNRDSFIKASDWIKEIRAERSSKTLVFLVGNKVDLEDERVVSAEEAAEKAEKENLFFIETSAKTDFQIQKLFDEVVKEIVKNMHNLDEQEQTALKNNPNKNIELNNEHGYWNCWCF
ncbi:Ras-related protein Rab6 [Schistosoma japonicum]|nr:Ras-related protein Rab6 [Schistosoma japonicum]